MISPLVFLGTRTEEMLAIRNLLLTWGIEGKDIFVPWEFGDWKLDLSLLEKQGKTSILLVGCEPEPFVTDVPVYRVFPGRNGLTMEEQLEELFGKVERIHEVGEYVSLREAGAIQAVSEAPRLFESPAIMDCYVKVLTLNPDFFPGGSFYPKLDNVCQRLGEALLVVANTDFIPGKPVGRDYASLFQEMRLIVPPGVSKERAEQIADLVALEDKGDGKRVFQQRYRWGIYHKPTGVLLQWGASAGHAAGKDLAAAYREAEKTAHADELLALRSWGSDEDGAPPGVTPKSDWWPAWPTATPLRKEQP